MSQGENKYGLKTLLQIKVFFSTKWKYSVVLLVALSIATAVLEGLGVAVIPIYITALTNPEDLNAIGPLKALFGEFPSEVNLRFFIGASSCFIGFMLFKNMAVIAIVFLRSTVLMKQQNELRANVFSRYQDASYEKIVQKNTADLIRNIQEDSIKIMNGVVVNCVTLLTSALTMACVFGVMVYQSPMATLLSGLLVGVGIAITIGLLKRTVSKAGETMREEYANTLRTIQTAFAGYVDVKISNRDREVAQRHIGQFENLTRASRTQSVANGALPYLVETISMVGLVVILFVFLLNAKDIQSSVPILSMLAYGTVRLKQSGSKVATSLNKIYSALPNIPELVQDYESIRSESERQFESVQQSGEKFSVDESFESLELKNVTFSYLGTDEKVLDNVDFRIEKGESVALVGPTGGGKSTIVRIVLGLLKPTQGKVLVNGADVFNDLAGWRNMIGYVPQSTYLLDDSVRRNVAFGIEDEQVDDNTVWRALEAAQIANFVESLPGQLDARVGEVGVRISGGQKQRLGIARALYGNPSVLVLDEATSALDGGTEDEVISAIHGLKGSKTLIMIAHRMQSLKLCDRFYRLNEGKAETVHSFDELITSTS